MDKFTFWKLIKATVTPSEIEGGEYPILLDALRTMSDSEIGAFHSLLVEHIETILPGRDDFERELLSDTPDVALSVKGAMVGPKGGDKVPLNDFLEQIDNQV